MTSKLLFRQGVCGIIIDDAGRILLGERTKDPGQWQLPQGGIEDGETPLEALHREIHEETGLLGLKVLAETPDFISYRWPRPLKQRRNSKRKRKFQGQEHIYFLLDGRDVKIRKLRPTKEFSAFGWFTVDDSLAEFISWKKPVCRKAFRLFGLIDS